MVRIIAPRLTLLSFRRGRTEPGSLDDPVADVKTGARLALPLRKLRVVQPL